MLLAVLQLLVGAQLPLFFLATTPATCPNGQFTRLWHHALLNLSCRHERPAPHSNQRRATSQRGALKRTIRQYSAV